MESVVYYSMEYGYICLYLAMYKLITTVKRKIIEYL